MLLIRGNSEGPIAKTEVSVEELVLLNGSNNGAYGLEHVLPWKIDIEKLNLVGFLVEKQNEFIFILLAWFYSASATGIFDAEGIHHQLAENNASTINIEKGVEDLHQIAWVEDTVDQTVIVTGTKNGLQEIGKT